MSETRKPTIKHKKKEKDMHIDIQADRNVDKQSDT